jgi:hypothetical protein
LYLKYYDSRLDVARRVLLRKKCVCDIEKRGNKYGNKLYLIMVMENG